MEIKKDMLGNLPEWGGDVPFQIKGIAVKIAHQAYWAMMKANIGKPKRFNFKSRKETKQSCFIPKTAIKHDGIYPAISGRNAKLFKEQLPEDVRDSRLIWRNRNWYLAIPHNKKIQPSSESQTSVVSLDPGIRSFISFYSPNVSGELGVDVSEVLFKYFFGLDNLYSRIARSTSMKKKKSYRKAAFRLKERINDLISDLHYKTANFLCKNFSVIILPKFEVAPKSRTIVSEFKGY
jgi:putative transposase